MTSFLRTTGWPLVLGLSLASLVWAGCPWNGLDDLAREAPVQMMERPDDFNSPQFGRVLVILDVTGERSRLVVGGQWKTPLAVIGLNGDGGRGKTHLASVDPADLEDAGDREGNMVEALVQIGPPADGAAQFLVGVPVFNYVRRITLATDGSLEADPQRIRLVKPAGTLSGFGAALASGQLDGSGPLDWAIAEEDYTFFIMNETVGATGLTCPIQATDAHPAVDRALLAGLFFEADGSDRQALAIGLPRDSGGQVSFVRWTGSSPMCEAAVLDSPTGKPAYGSALAARDLNGDGLDDLIVGAPDGADSRVYIYFTEGPPGARTLDASPVYVLTPSEPDAVAFGATVALADLDGDGAPEILVGDPEAPYADTGNLGRVHIYQHPWAAGGAVGEAWVIGDPASPDKLAGVDIKEKTSGFGAQIAPIGWNEPSWPGQELVVGATERIFVFFRSTLPGDDDASADPR